MPKGVTLTPDQQEERRQAIVQIAMELFSQNGVEKTSMREIAVTAGMGKSTMYDFFASKDEIAVYAVEGAITGAIQKAEEIRADELPPEQCLRAMMKINLSFTKDYKDILLWLSSESRYMAKEYQQRLSAIRHQYQDIVQAVIERGIAEGIFSTRDPALATRLLINSMLSIAYTSRPSDSLENMLEEAVNIFLHGMMS